MDRLRAMEVFVNVVESGSQSIAARRLDLSRPVVSRYLASLEDWAGARLLHRSTRRLALTAAGEETLLRCRQMLALAGEMRTPVAAPHEKPRGLLRISCITSFGQAQLSDALNAFIVRYPEVSVDLVLLDRAVNLIEERIDLAIRITNELDPNLIARRLSVCHSVLCASPGYLSAHGAPAGIEELARRNCLTHSYYTRSLWHFARAGQHGLPASVAVSGTFTANDSAVLLRAAQGGAGIAMLPTYLARPSIEAGLLVALLPGDVPQPLDINAVFTSRKHLPLAMRAMLDFLAAYFPREPWWDRGGTRAAREQMAAHEPARERDYLEIR